MPEPLIERVAAAVAQGYRDLPLDHAAGVLLDTYWDGEAEQLVPLALALTEVHDDVHNHGDLDQLGYPEIWRDDPALFALCEQLNARFNEDEDGNGLLTDYFQALARHLHTLLGLPVLVADSEMPVSEQLRRQAGAPQMADPLAGLEVLVRVAVDEYQTAAVIQGPTWPYAVARAGEDDPEGEIPLGQYPTEIGHDPHIVGGLLPPGVRGVVLEDRKGGWHEATVGGGAWLCALPQRSGAKAPPFSYVNAAGTRFRPTPGAWAGDSPYEDLRREAAAVCAGATVPALWPVQASERPVFAGWEGPRERATGLVFTGGDWVISIRQTPSTADEVLECRLRSFPGGSRARRSTTTGAFEGRIIAFDRAELSDESWVMVGALDGFTVTVQCSEWPLDNLVLARV